MKTAEARDLMVAKVQEYFPDHRTFKSNKEVKPKVGQIVVPVTNPDVEASYVESLHLACSLGTIVGRSEWNLVVDGD